MRLRARLVLIVAAASTVPIGVLGFGASRLAGQELEARVDFGQGQTAQGLALYSGTWLDSQLDLVGLQARSLRVAALSGGALTGYQRLVYKQTAAAGIITLTDRSGNDVSPPVYLDAKTASDAGRPVVGIARVERFRDALPLDGLALQPAAVDGGALMGAPYLPDDASAPVVPIAVPIPGTAMVLGVELGLDTIARRVDELARSGLDAAILDNSGAAFIMGPGEHVSAESLRPLIGATAVSVRYVHEGVDVRAATAPVVGTGWTVVVAAPASDGAQAVQGIQARTAFLALIAAALAIGMGSVWAGRLAQPVLRLRDAAMAVAEGEVGRKVQPGGDEELAELGRTFNHMSEQLRRDADEIAKQKSEIEAFNEELQSRVDQRTAELREAQERLLQSARLAAVGEMGAGLAHELNNPLAGILGLTQVLHRRVPTGPEAEMLASLEREARRCSDIVASLLGFSQELPVDVGMTAPDRAQADVKDVLAEVLALVSPPLRQRGLTIADEVEDGLGTGVPRAELGRAIAQLLTSVRAAARGGGSLLLASGTDDASVELIVTLTGPDLQLGGDDWKAAGLGLWAVRRALDAHGGRLVEPAESGTGPLTWRVILPRAET